MQRNHYIFLTCIRGKQVDKFYVNTTICFQMEYPKVCPYKGTQQLISQFFQTTDKKELQFNKEEHHKILNTAS